MAAYNLIVSYDLNRPGQDYQTLFSAIRSLGGAIKVQKSVWYVDTNYDEKQARDHLIRVMDRNDSLIVVNSTTDAIAWHGLAADVEAFLRARWPKKQRQTAFRKYG
jgi:hypothetical protein